jgi:hypothetical protein
MPVFSLQNNIDLELVSLLHLLAIFTEAEEQAKPYLIKDGYRIVF